MKIFKTKEEAKSLGDQEAQIVLSLYIEAIIEESYILNPSEAKNLLEIIKSKIEKHIDDLSYNFETTNEEFGKDENIKFLFNSIERLRKNVIELPNYEKEYLEGMKGGILTLLNIQVRELNIVIHHLNNLKEADKQEIEYLLTGYTKDLKKSEIEKRKAEYRLMLKIADENISDTDKQKIIEDYRKNKKEKEEANIEDLRQQ